MEEIMRYRGKSISRDDIDRINTLIETNPGVSRRSLSKKLCEHWNWVQANGALRDMVCRGLMLALHRAGYITLPAKKQHPTNPFVNRRKPENLIINTSSFTGTIQDISSGIQFRQVRRSDDEPLFNSLIEQYHYLGYCHPVGEQLKYIVYAMERPVACFAFSSAPRHIGCRDRFIGWNQETRKQNISLMAYNSRFLILPWIRVENFASHLLSRMVRILPGDWLRMYQHPIYFLETFVDTERFQGTCYKAANWIYLGRTTGRGKDDQTYRQNRSIKAVYGYPLRKDFKKLLCANS
jgi:hypothetical protein